VESSIGLGGRGAGASLGGRRRRGEVEKRRWRGTRARFSSAMVGSGKRVTKKTSSVALRWSRGSIYTTIFEIDFAELGMTGNP
jgi:hypothetical protein